MSIKPSLGGIAKPTPPILRGIFNALLYVVGAWGIISSLFNFLPPETINTINKDILIILPLLRFTITFFHYDYDIPDETVPDNNNPSNKNQ